MSLFKESRVLLRKLYARALELQIFAWDAEREDLHAKIVDAGKIILEVIGDFDQAREVLEKQIRQASKVLNKAEEELMSLKKKEVKKEKKKTKVMIDGKELSPSLAVREQRLLRAFLRAPKEQIRGNPAALVSAVYEESRGPYSFGRGRLTCQEYLETGYDPDVKRICGKYELWFSQQTTKIVTPQTQHVFVEVEKAIGTPEALRHAFSEIKENYSSSV